MQFTSCSRILTTQLHGSTFKLKVKILEESLIILLLFLDQTLSFTEEWRVRIVIQILLSSNLHQPLGLCLHLMEMLSQEMTILASKFLRTHSPCLVDSSMDQELTNSLPLHMMDNNLWQLKLKNVERKLLAQEILTVLCIVKKKTKFTYLVDRMMITISWTICGSTILV